MSCREFVRNVLPSQQVHTPQQLDNTVKAGLEREMVNSNTQLVMGDGLEMDSPAEDTSDSLNGYSGDDDSTDDGSRDRNSEYDRTSWVRQSPDVSLVLEDEQGQDHEVPVVSISATTSTASTRSSPKRSRFRFSLLSPLSAEFPPTPALSEHSVSQSDNQASDVPQSPQSLRNHHRRATGALGRLHGLSMSPSVTTAPMPTIRSRHRAISHPDISSLCQEWADSGPANRTTCYTVDLNGDDDNNGNT